MLAAQLLISGIAVGLLYALTAVGVSLIFWTTRVFHIAHGATFLLAAYAFVEVRERAGVAVAMVASVLAAMIFGYCVNRLVYRPIQRSGSSFFALFVASFGALILVGNIVSMVLGADLKTLPTFGRTFDVGGLQIPSLAIVSLLIAVAFLFLLQIFLLKTDTGVGLRAMADDVSLVDLLGLNRRRLGTIAFVIGSVMVVPAAILTTYSRGVQPTSGLAIGTVGLVVAIAGGVGSLPGAVVGGLLLGIVENISILWVNPVWGEVIGFSVLLAILVFRPAGIIPRQAQSR